MDTAPLVDKFKRIRGRSDQYQRNAIQLSRNHAFQKLNFWGYFWRFIIVPLTSVLVVMAAPWQFTEYNDLGFLGTAFVAALTGYYVERWMYFRMINRGLDYFLKNPRMLTSEFIPRPPVIDTIHRCGAPPDWGQAN